MSRRATSKEVGLSWYLPNFPVIRENRETTKVRIVFDSAARCKGISWMMRCAPGLNFNEMFWRYFPDLDWDLSP